MKFMEGFDIHSLAKVFFMLWFTSRIREGYCTGFDNGFYLSQILFFSARTLDSKLKHSKLFQVGIK